MLPFLRKYWGGKKRIVRNSFSPCKLGIKLHLPLLPLLILLTFLLLFDVEDFHFNKTLVLDMRTIVNCLLFSFIQLKIQVEGGYEYEKANHGSPDLPFYIPFCW